VANELSNSSKKANAQQLQRGRSALAKSALFLLCVATGAGAAGAYPVSPTPAPVSSPSTSPSPAPKGNVLPFDSDLIFVIDESISSKASHAGQIVKIHLKNDLAVGGRVVAPAGTPGSLRIVAVSHADVGDVYGFVDIYFEPLTLPDGRTLPLRAPFARLAPRDSYGHESTVALEDTVADQVIPFHWLYHILRKGKNFVLSPGSEIPARTEATLTALPNGTVAIETPRPPATNLAIPNSSFPVEPIATPFGPAGGKRQVHPTPSPTPWATPAWPSSSPSASPSPSGSPPTPN
jgi:hypothetical protein